jgi:hypothetical protein
MRKESRLLLTRLLKHLLAGRVAKVADRDNTVNPSGDDRPGQPDMLITLGAPARRARACPPGDGSGGKQRRFDDGDTYRIRRFADERGRSTYARYFDFGPRPRIASSRRLRSSRS